MGIILTTPKKLARMTKALKSKKFTKPLKQAQAVMIRSVQVNFNEGGRPNKWPTSRAAVRRRGKTLLDTGLLRGSIVPGARMLRSSKLGDRSQYRVSELSATRAVIGTSLPYAMIHHFGGRSGKGGRTVIIARPFMLVVKKDRLLILQKFADYIVELLG